jgi:hypothetical protein
MIKCDGCKGEFQEWELTDSCDDKYKHCLNCTYAYEANLDEVTGDE